MITIRLQHESDCSMVETFVTCNTINITLTLRKTDSKFDDAAYVTVLWALGGYLNTCSYMVAPTCVASNHKANAAGLMAITSQVSHCAGLLFAVILASILFGGVVDV